MSRTIRSFADARKVDIANERLPQFEQQSGIFPAPSMRLSGRGGDIDESVETLIRRTIREEIDEENADEDGLVDRVAERLSHGRTLAPGRPSALKRHGTTG